MAFPASGRFAPLSIKKHFEQAKVDIPAGIFTAVLTMVAFGSDKSLRFNAVVRVLNGGVEVAAYDVAAPGTGKLANYGDVDGGLKMLAGIIPSSTGEYSVAIDVGSILDKVPASDLVAAATNQRTSYQNARVKSNAAIADIDTQLALMVGWENGNSLQVAKKAETNAQRATVVALVASYDAEITRLTAIIGV
jgi:hypothetical protein